MNLTRMSANPADWSLTDQVGAMKTGTLTAVDLAEATLKRIEARQPVLNCFIRVDEEGTRAAAKAADARRETGEPLGPLHGAPLAHKDMYYRKGVPVTCGSEIRRAFVPDVTATVLEKLDAAGALHVGALNMSEFASGPTGHNEHWGTCRNPWNPAHITGGSSTGSGSSVGGRLVAGSLGSDTGGSIRLPAGICGVYGIKPTQGRVSRHGVMGLSFSLDNVGPLARTARDCARILTAIAGPDPKDTTALPVPAEDYEADIDAGVKGMTIAIPETFYFDDIDPEVAKAIDAVIAAYESQGANIVRVTLPHHDVIDGLGSIVSAAEQCTIHDHWQRTCPEKYAPLIRARMMAGYGVTAVEYLKAMHLRSRIASDVAAAAFGGAQVMLAPTVRFPVPTLEEMDVKDSPNMPEALGRVNHSTRPINYLGFPGLSVPCGFTASGLPIGFQLIGPAFSERMLFRFAGAYEAAVGLPDALPDLP
ncbi:amidase [Oceanicola sp. 22II-s10i]|uniref:amidase n=1 Tax=Oceanicola sp. 22II-s10i TaxID=1317116 RepID=UPI000B51F434|nr:amidase [Oceanicola sp. 22II-s10i]